MDDVRGGATIGGVFADALRGFAEQSGDARLTPILSRLTAPIRVSVYGRGGVGRSTVAAALGVAGVAVTEGAGDVAAMVVAETVKPEDLARIRTERAPVVIRNKADLSEPLEVAGVRMVPMIALLAVTQLDDESVGALRVLVERPADLSSTDAFAECAHPLSAEVRRHLLTMLDRFGIACAVSALADGTPGAALTELLRDVSNVDQVVADLHDAAAPTRYRRVRLAATQLRCVAAQSSDDRLATFLASDDTVLGMMSAAVDVVQAAGLSVDRAEDPRAHLRRAIHWRRYGRGPVGALHRHAASDICRGSLRLLGRPS